MTETYTDEQGRLCQRMIKLKTEHTPNISIAFWYGEKKRKQFKAEKLAAIAAGEEYY